MRIRIDLNIVIILCAVSLLWIVSGCRQNVPAELLRAEALIGERPDSALSILDSISSDALSEENRHYRDLLYIKASDKAYITHVSDSLILDVIDYYGRCNKSHYPEALYYGGRVYSDMGDYPSALRYFQNSLDLLTDDYSDLTLRGSVNSQTGRLLNAMRLSKEPIPYLKEAIRCDSILRDTLNYMYDTQLLGSILIDDKDYSGACNYLLKSRSIAEIIDPVSVFQTDVYLAQIKCYEGDIDSSLSIIRRVLDKVDPLDRGNALSTASMIYKKAGIYDTAYIYSKVLIDKRRTANRLEGYRTLFSKELIGTLPIDTLKEYVMDYVEAVENRFNRNKANSAIIQNSIYNYTRYVRAKEKSDHDNEVLILCVAALLLIIIALTVLTLYLKYRNKTKIINLQDTLKKLELVKSENHIKKKIDNTEAIKISDITKIEIEPDEDQCVTVKRGFGERERELRERLERELRKLEEISQKEYKVPAVISESEAYNHLFNKIRNNSGISHTDPFWEELKNMVVESSPDFLKKLTLLIGKPTEVDIHTALLIKCGLTPTEMALIFSRSKSAIVSRRDSLSIKIFGEKTGTKHIDAVIRTL